MRAISRDTYRIPVTAGAMLSVGRDLLFFEPDYWDLNNSIWTASGGKKRSLRLKQ